MTPHTIGGADCWNRLNPYIGFNSGIYAKIDLSEWIAGNPIDVLATNFGKPASLFEKFPRKDVFIVPEGGPNSSK